jgi:glycerophosphoryl diester phosphodiesterase
LAEIKRLRARERLPFRNQGWNGMSEIPTFQEVIDLAKRRSAANGRIIGIYPETKHPSYFRSIGLPLEPLLLEALEGNGYSDASAPVFVQSFEVQNLKDLRRLTKVRLIQLMEDARLQPYDFVAAGDRRTYGDLMTAKALAEIAAYAHGIGPWKRSIVPQGSDGALLPPTSLVADAHNAGLVVHPYTFGRARVSRARLPVDPTREYLQFLSARRRRRVLGFRRHRCACARHAAALSPSVVIVRACGRSSNHRMSGLGGLRLSPPARITGCPA